MNLNPYLYSFMICYCLFMSACSGNQPSSAAGNQTDSLDSTNGSQIEATEDEALPESSTANVWSYYQKLHKQYAPDFVIQQREGNFKYRTNTGFWNDAIVDIPNGYIEIYDEGTGDGYYHLQFVQFKKADGSSIIMISTRVHDGISVRADHKALDVSGSSPTDITAKVFNGLDAFAFLPADYAEEEEIVLDALPVIIDLPRKGTTAKANISTEKRHIYCTETADEQQAIGCAVIGRVVKKELSLTWDRNAGIFKWR